MLHADSHSFFEGGLISAHSLEKSVVEGDNCKCATILDAFESRHSGLDFKPYSLQRGKLIFEICLLSFVCVSIVRVYDVCMFEYGTA